MHVYWFIASESDAGVVCCVHLQATVFSLSFSVFLFLSFSRHFPMHRCLCFLSLSVQTSLLLPLSLDTFYLACIPVHFSLYIAFEFLFVFYTSNFALSLPPYNLLSYASLLLCFLPPFLSLSVLILFRSSTASLFENKLINHQR